MHDKDGLKTPADPAKGEFVPPPEIVAWDEEPEALPAQDVFRRPPVRFGTIPVGKEPLGWASRLLVQATQLTAQHSLSKP